MKQNMKHLCWLLVLTTLLAGCTLIEPVAPLPTENVDPDRTSLETLSGTYASLATEEWYGAYGTRTFTFADGRWAL